MNGIYTDTSTRERVIILDGKRIAACSLDLPRQVQDEWLTELLLRMPAQNAVKVLLQDGE